MAERTFLHVVYAGRGDAFIVEYLDSHAVPPVRRVVLVDGGPTNWTSATPAISKKRKFGGLSSPKAPYYRYFLSTCYSVWNRLYPDGRPFAPDGIWISHPHQDHYGGILQLLLSEMSGPSPKMNFRGPIWTPYVPRTSGTIELDLYLKRLEFKREWGAINSLGFTVDYPSIDPTEERVVTYRIPTTQPKPARDFSVDESNENLLSTLMHHDTVVAGNLNSQIYFTGDSAGWQILQHVPTTHAIPIYKIQHHGSMRNVQATNTNTKVDWGVAGEAQLLGLLSWALSGGGDDLKRERLPYYAIRSHVSNDNLKDLYDELNIFWVKRPEPLTQAQVLAELEVRADQYITQAQDRAIVRISAPDDGYADIWKRFQKSIDQAEKPNAHMVGWNGKRRVDISWWRDYKDDDYWKDKYFSVLTTTRARDFFSRFSALSYVVSANGTYQHVCAETVLGLALALSDKPQAATLYVTDGQCIDLDEIQFLCEVIEEDMQTKFGPSALTIRYMRSTAFVTLDASVTVTGDRDFKNVTGVMKTSPDFQTYLQIRDNYDKDRTILPLRTLGPNASFRMHTENTTLPQHTLVSNVFCFTACTLGRPEVSLDIDTATFLPVIRIAAIAARFEVLEAWEVGLQDFTHLRLSSLAAPPRQATIRYLVSEKEKGHFQIIYRDDDNVEFSFFLDVRGDPMPAPTATVPAGTPILLFRAQRAVSAVDKGVKVVTSSGKSSPRRSTQTLGEYCADIGENIPATFTGTDALNLILGADNAAALSYDLPFQVSMLGLSPDLNGSTVDYSNDSIDLMATAAQLNLNVPSGTQLNIGGTLIDVASVSVAISWPGALTATLTIMSDSSQGISISASRKVPNAIHSANLPRFLKEMRFAEDATRTLTIGKLLAFLGGNDDKIINKLGRVPSVLLSSGLMFWKPDIARSYLIANWTIIGNAAVEQAYIEADISTLPSISMAGITLSIDAVAFVLKNARLDSETLTLSGTASIGQSSGSKATLTLSISLESEVTRLTCTLQGSISSIPDLVHFLPAGGGDMGSVIVPFKNSPLLTLKTSGVGFRIIQPIGATQTYDIESVFAATSFSDWKQFLPSDFPVPKDVDFTILLEVFYPLIKEQRAVRVVIDFRAPITTGTSPKIIDVIFVAQPLVSANDYEFRLGLKSSGGSTAATLNEILTGLHMDGLVTVISSNLPTVGSILDAVSVNEVTVSLIQQGDPSSWQFNDWHLDLHVAQWTVVPKYVEISDARIQCDRIAGAWMCDIDANLLIAEAFNIDVKLRMPQLSTPGYVTIDNPNGLSGTQLLKAFGLPDLTAVPVVGALLDATVFRASVTMGYGSSAAGRTGPLSIQGGEIWIGLDELNIGFMTLNAVEVGLTYHSATDPLGTMREQQTFTVTSIIADGSFEVDLFYDSLLHTVSGSLRPLKAKTVIDAINMLLPPSIGIPNDLLPLIGLMNVELISIMLSSVDGFKILGFSLSLLSGAVIGLNAVKLGSLRVDYTAQIKATGSEPEIPMSYILFAQIVGPKAQADVQISCVKGGASPKSSSLSTKPLAKTHATDNVTVFPTDTEILVFPSDFKTNRAHNIVEASARAPILSDNVDSMKSAAASVKQHLSNPPPATVTTFKASLTETPGGMCTLLGLMGLFGITRPKYNVPEEAETVDFFDLNIVSASAQLSMIAGMSSLELDSLKLQVQTVGSLKILDTPPVTLTQIQFELDYERNGITTGLVSGGVEVYLKKESKLLIWAAYDGCKYSGTATIGNDQQIDFKDLAAQWLRSDQYQMPVDPAPPAQLPCTAFYTTLRPRRSLEIAGNAATNWNFIVAGVDVTLTNVGGRVKIYQDPSKDVVYEAYLYGDLSFVGFHSTARGSVGLRIGKDQPTILTSSLQPTDASSLKQIDNVTGKLADSSHAKWSTLIPSGANAIAFDSSVFLWVDFTQSQFAIFGQIQSMGTAILLGRPNYHGPGRSYLFSLAIADIATLLPGLGDVLSAFNFVKIGVDVVALDGTVADIAKDLTEISAVAIEEGVAIQSTVPTLASFGTESLKTGMSLYGIIDLSGSSTLSALLGLGANDKMSSSITLSALLMQSNPAKSAFLLTVDHFSMLGGAVVVTGTGTYTPDAKTLDVAGNIILTLSSSNSLDLKVELCNVMDTLTFRTTTKGTLFEPFGGMFGITVKEVEIQGTFTAKVSEYQVSGKVQLGSVSSGLDFTAHILFSSDFQPTVASIGITESISVIDLLADIIPGLSWPRGYDPITFEVPSDLYYSTSSLIICDKTYEKGYNIASKVKFFGFDFVVTASLLQKGVIVNASFHTNINFGFMDLVGYTVAGPPSKAFPGPTVSINTTNSDNTEYSAYMGLIFFGLKDYQVDIKVIYQASDQWSGTATLKSGFFGVISPSKPITAQIKYANEHWQIVNMPIFKDMRELVDLAKTIMDATSESDPCGKLVGLSFQETITTKWDLQLGNARISDSGDLQADITGSYVIYIFGHKIVRVKMPDLPLVVKGPLSRWSADTLLEKVGDSILQSLESIGRALLEQPENLTAIFAAVSVVKLGPEVITKLLCRNVSSENLLEEAANELDEMAKDLDKPDGDPSQSESASSSSESAGSSGGAASFLSSAGAALGAAVAGLHALNQLVDKYKKNEKDHDKIAHAEAQRNAAQDKVGQASAAFGKAQTTFQTTLNLSGTPTSGFSSGSGNELIVSWDHVMPAKPGFDYQNYANVTWEVRYGFTDSFDAAVKLQPTPPTATNIIIIDDEILFNGTVFAWVTTLYTDKSGREPIEYRSLNNAAAQNAEHVPALRPPPKFHFVLADVSNCMLVVPSVPKAIYDADIVDVDHTGVILASHKVTQLQGGDLNIPISILDLEATAPVLRAAAQLRQISSDPQHTQSSPWTSSIEILPVTSGPARLAVETDGDDLIISWLQTTTKLSDFELSIRKLDGTWSPGAVVALRAGQEGTTVVAVTGGDVVEGTVVNIAVRPTANPETVCLFSKLDNYQIRLLPRPSIVFPDSYYDLASNSIFLAWTLPRPLPAGAQFSLDLVTGSPDRIFPARGVIARPPQYSMIVPWNDLPVTVRVGVLSASGAQGALSDGWNISALPSSPPSMTEPRVLVDSQLVSYIPLVARWSINPFMTTVIVQVKAGDDIVASKSGPSNVEALNFTQKDFAYALETEFTFVFIPCQDVFRGKPAYVQFSIPSVLQCAISYKQAHQSCLAAWIALYEYTSEGIGPAEMFGSLLAAGYTEEETGKAAFERLGLRFDFHDIRADFRQVETAFMPLLQPKPPSPIIYAGVKDSIRLVGALFPQLSAVVVAAAAKNSGMIEGSFGKYGALIAGVTHAHAIKIDDAIWNKYWILGDEFKQSKVSVDEGLRTMKMAWETMIVEVTVAIFTAAAIAPTLAQLQTDYPTLTQNQLDAINATLHDTPSSPSPGRGLARLLRKRSVKAITNEELIGIITSVYPFLSSSEISDALDKHAALGFNGVSTVVNMQSLAPFNAVRDGFTVEATFKFPTSFPLVHYQPIISFVMTYASEGFTFDGNIIQIPAMTPVLKVGVDPGGTLSMNLLLPKEFRDGKPFFPHPESFNAPDSPLIQNDWNNLSVTWRPHNKDDPYGGGALSTVLNGDPIAISPVSGKIGSNSVDTQSFIDVDWSLMVGVAFDEVVRVTGYFAGEMCNLRFWTPGRAAADVAADPQPFPPQDVKLAGQNGLIHYWGCDEGSGTIVADALGGKNGTVVDPIWIKAMDDR